MNNRNNRLSLSTRIIMFAICTSLEHDIKKFIVTKSVKVGFSEAQIKKATSRKKKFRH